MHILLYVIDKFVYHNVKYAINTTIRIYVNCYFLELGYLGGNRGRLPDEGCAAVALSIITLRHLASLPFPQEMMEIGAVSQAGVIIHTR